MALVVCDETWACIACTCRLTCDYHNDERLPGNWPIVIISAQRTHSSFTDTALISRISLSLSSSLIFYSFLLLDRRRIAATVANGGVISVYAVRVRENCSISGDSLQSARQRHSLVTYFAGWASLQLQQLSRSRVTSALDVVRVVSNVRWSWLRVTLQCMRSEWRRHFRRLFCAILSFTLTDCR